MSNKSISMYEYRQVISHMRLGEPDRAIARSGLVSRTKARQIRSIAKAQNWLDPMVELPTDALLAEFFDRHIVRKSTESLALPYKNEIEQWVEQAIQATTIHQALVRKYGFGGAYNCVERMVQKIRAKQVRVSTVLDFLPGESAQGYGFIISACPPREPQKKGRVESGVKYVKKNFFPLREFRDLVDANRQLKPWVLGTAGNRTHGTTQDKPLNRFEGTEKHLLHSCQSSLLRAPRAAR